MCSCGGISLDGGAGIVAGDRCEQRDFDFGEVTSRLIAVLPQFTKLDFQFRWLERDRTPSVADQRGVSQRTVATGADDDWRMRLLRGFGFASDRRKFDKFAFEAGLVPRPKFLHRADVLA